MIRVVVVEDEWILRTGLINSIDWTALGCVVAGEAENGREGLDIILKERPDIVVADIRMPIMDGLEMIEAASQKHRFWSILLTSYSEFEYARQAVSLQVFEYLLKPVNECVLCEVLVRLCERIRRDDLSELLLERIQNNGQSADSENLYIQVADGDPDNYYVTEVLNEIHEHYKQKISIETIARRLNVSASYLSRRFRKTAQRSFLGYLNQYRVTKAIQLLNIGKYRFGEVADMTGFTDHKHFYNVFRKYTGLTPSEFVKEKVLIVSNDPNAPEDNPK